MQNLHGISYKLYKYNTQIKVNIGIRISYPTLTTQIGEI